MDCHPRKSQLHPAERDLTQRRVSTDRDSAAGPTTLGNDFDGPRAEDPYARNNIVLVNLLPGELEVLNTLLLRVPNCCSSGRVPLTSLTYNLHVRLIPLVFNRTSLLDLTYFLGTAVFCGPIGGCQLDPILQQRFHTPSPHHSSGYASLKQAIVPSQETDNAKLSGTAYHSAGR